MASIRITGGAGCAGNAVAAALLAAGHRVVVFDRAPPPGTVRAHLGGLGAGVDFVAGEVLDPAGTLAAVVPRVLCLSSASWRNMARTPQEASTATSRRGRVSPQVLGVQGAMGHSRRVGPIRSA